MTDSFVDDYLLDMDVFSMAILDYQRVHISAGKLLSASWSSGFSWDFGGQNMSAEWFGLLKIRQFHENLLESNPGFTDL